MANHIDRSYASEVAVFKERRRLLQRLRKLTNMHGISAPFDVLAAHYERCLRDHGDTAQGVDWPDAEGALIRYRVMAEVARDGGGFLDFGCGAGHFLEYLQQTHSPCPPYRGLDISPVFIDLCRYKFPATVFDRLDVLAPGAIIPSADYVVMNGVFTEKREVPYDVFFEAMTQVLVKVFAIAQRGMAFNLMSKYVDWERDDLFHVAYDDIVRFVTSLSRHHTIRADYGLREYTVYVYKHPTK